MAPSPFVRAAPAANGAGRHRERMDVVLGEEKACATRPLLLDSLHFDDFVK
jgi:hypothetical protein